MLQVQTIFLVPVPTPCELYVLMHCNELQKKLDIDCVTKFNQLGMV